MKRTALLAAAAFLLVVGPATAATKTIRGTVVAKHARSGTIVLAGPKGLGVTVRVSPRRVRLGDRVSVAGTRLRDGTIRAARLSVLAHVRTAEIRGVVVKRLAGALRVASGHSVLTIHTGRRLSSAGDHGDQRVGEIGEFEIEIENGDLFEHGFQAVPQAGTVRIEGVLVSVSPLVVSLEGLPIEITVPAGVTLPALTPGQEIELTVQTGSGNTFTLVSIDDEAANPVEEVEAKGAVVTSSATQITVDAGGAMLTFTAPNGVTLPVLTAGTFVEARGVTVNGVLTLTRLRVEDGGDGGGDDGGGGGDGGGGHH
jgi:FtsP/CotA-like multicopper oxidase with cupredoxin domain